MSEYFPEDLGTGIPPIRGKTMSEIINLGREIAATGTSFDDLIEGQTYNYISGSDRFFVTILDGQNFSKLHNADRPLVTVQRVTYDGQVLDSSGGILLGVSLTGDGNFPMPFLPPEESEYVPFVIETLPSTDEPEACKVRVLRSDSHFE